MGTFRSLFGRSKTADNTTTKSKISNPTPIDAGLKSQPYDLAVALAPPVKGSYPVAGNGANVLHEIQRTRAKRQSQAESVVPNTSRRRDDVPNVPMPVQVPVRPQTAPHDGTPGGGYTHGRTRSGFSMKPPPSFFSPGRRDSLKTSQPPPLEKDTPPVSAPAPTPPPQITSPPSTRGRGREPAYQPPLANSSIPEGFTPPFAHNRSQSQASRKTHVDLLDAHSTIKNSREQSQHRAKASGVRDYGEDVADRNIAAFSSEHHMDLNSPEYSYLKKAYNSQPGSDIGRDSPGRDGPVRERPGRDDPARERPGRDRSARDNPGRDSPTIGTAAHSKKSPVAVPRVVSQLRPGSAAGRVAKNNVTTGDDTAPARAGAPTTTTTSTRVPPIRHLRTSSMRPNVSRLSQSRPTTAIPPRTDSATTRAYSANRGRNDAASPSPNDSHDQNVRPMSPLSTTSSIDHEPPTRNPRRPSLTSSIAGSTSGRAEKSVSFRDPPPVALLAQFRVSSPSSSSAPASKVTTPSHSRQPSNTSVTRGSSLASRRQRTASMSSQNTIVPQVHGRTGSKNNSIGYGPPSVAGPSSPSSPTSKMNRETYVQGSSNPISLEGIVDLSNTVDTEVITKSLPAVTHEHVMPALHEIRHEEITREIHTHDIFHRILPVIETEVLPTKHYVPSADGRGLVEIPEHMLPGRTETGSPSRNWEIVEIGLGRGDHGARVHHSTQSSRTVNDYERPREGAEAPVAGYRGARNGRSSSSVSLSSVKRAILEPILSSKKEYITKEGHPKTEYVWRHPPVFETADGKTTPVLIPAGYGETRESWSSDGSLYSQDTVTHAHPTPIAISDMARQVGKSEEDLLYRDSGYGAEGMLPGLHDPTPMAGYIGRANTTDLSDDAYAAQQYLEQHPTPMEEKTYNLPRDHAQVEGEATRALRRMKEKRSQNSSIDSTASVSNMSTGINAHVGSNAPTVAKLEELETKLRGLNMDLRN